MGVPDPRLVARFRRLSRGASWAVMAVGTLVFVGWALNAPTVNRLIEGWFIMHLNTGIGFVLAGLSLFLTQSRRRLALACALGVALIGLGVLVENALFGARAGRMEQESAGNFILFGAALALRLSRSQKLLAVGQAGTMVALFGALVAAYTHSYAVRFTWGLTTYAQMTTGTMLAFLVLGLGVLFADPDRGLMRTLSSDTPGGSMARRLIPAVVCLPLALGWFTLFGEHMHWWNGKMGLSLFALSSIVAFAVLVSLTYQSIDRADAQRMRLAAILLEEAERRHLARELHDEIGQSLTALKFHLEMVGRGAPEDGAERVREARALVDELMGRVSSLSLDLRPAMLDDLGLLPALVWLLDRYRAQTGIQVQFQKRGLGDGKRLPRELETAAFRVVQEALTNAARHSGSKQVTVRAWADGAQLGVQVEDGGRGFSADEALARASSSGLMGMRERAAALGGQLTIDAEPGRGCTITAEFPVEPRVGSVVTS